MPIGIARLTVVRPRPIVPGTMVRERQRTARRWVHGCSVLIQRSRSRVANAYQRGCCERATTSRDRRRRGSLKGHERSDLTNAIAPSGATTRQDARISTPQSVAPTRSRSADSIGQGRSRSCGPGVELSTPPQALSAADTSIRERARRCHSDRLRPAALSRVSSHRSA